MLACHSKAVMVGPGPRSVRTMSWSKYAEFLAFAVVLVLIPGPDFAVVTKNTLVGGRQRGRWTALGVSSSNLVQGTAAAFGVSALIVRVQPLFEAVKWAGVGYLAYLGAQAIRSALRGQYQPADEAERPGAEGGGQRHRSERAEPGPVAQRVGAADRDEEGDDPDRAELRCLMYQHPESGVEIAEETHSLRP